MPKVAEKREIERKGGYQPKKGNEIPRLGRVKEKESDSDFNLIKKSAKEVPNKPYVTTPRLDPII